MLASTDVDFTSTYLKGMSVGILDGLEVLGLKLIQCSINFGIDRNRGKEKQDTFRGSD